MHRSTQGRTAAQPVLIVVMEPGAVCWLIAPSACWSRSFRSRLPDYAASSGGGWLRSTPFSSEWTTSNYRGEPGRGTTSAPGSSTASPSRCRPDHHPINVAVRRLRVHLHGSLRFRSSSWSIIAVMVVRIRCRVQPVTVNLLGSARPRASPASTSRSCCCTASACRCNRCPPHAHDHHASREQPVPRVGDRDGSPTSRKSFPAAAAPMSIPAIAASACSIHHSLGDG